MEIKIRQPESKIFNGSVLFIDNWERTEDLINIASKITIYKKPIYIYCEIESTRTKDIHKLEQHEYFFSEFRIHSILRLSDISISTRLLFPYNANLIGNVEHLNKAVSILNEVNCDDRYSNDEVFGKENAKKRNIENLRKSFYSYPKEFLLGVFNSQTNQMVAFRSGEFVNANEVIYFQYAINKNFASETIPGMLEAFTIEYLQKQKVQLVHYYSTGFNISELNRLINDYNFRISSTNILLRKCFR